MEVTSVTLYPVFSSVIVVGSGTCLSRVIVLYIEARLDYSLCFRPSTQELSVSYFRCTYSESRYGTKVQRGT